jgi:hypothetical protein
MTPPPVSFSSWGEASAKGFHARGLWTDKGYRVKDGEKSYADVETEDGFFIKVYHEAQVRELKEPMKSRRILIGRFLGRTEWFGYGDCDKGRISQWHTSAINLSMRDLIYRTFTYRNRSSGIGIPFHDERKRGARADALYVRAGEKTRYLVLDVDNHLPNMMSTEVHLRLVKRLVDLMPRLLSWLGGAKVFYDYRQESPQGIHIWIMLPYLRTTKHVHQRVRTFLINNSDPELDMALRMNGLLEMGSLEILPSESHLMRFFGGWDRRVFTTEELKPNKEGFDAQALLAHLNARTQVGDPCPRYGELARAGVCSQQARQVRVRPCPKVEVVTADRPSQRSNYFAYLVDACLNGVMEDDVLFGAYLVPIATALYFRDFHNHPRRNEQVVLTVMGWLQNKHNSRVTRIEEGKTKNLEGILRGIVKKMDSTPTKVRGFWASVRQRDLAHPDHRISLVESMERVLEKPFPVTKENLSEVRRLVEGGDALPSTSAGAVEVFLPTTVEARLRDHLARCDVALGACTDRIVRFAEKLIQEIGVQGQRTISSGRINQLALLGKGRKTAGRYKKLLVGAGILLDRGKGHWVGKRSAQYRLTDWVMDEVRKETMGVRASPSRTVGDTVAGEVPCIPPQHGSHATTSTFMTA